MPISKFEINGWMKNNFGVNQTKGYDLGQSCQPIGYITMRARVTGLTHATSYDVLVGGAVLYPLELIIDFWDYYHPRCQIGASHKASLLVRLIGGVSWKIQQIHYVSWIFRFSA
jgi:hypothetical protein